MMRRKSGLVRLVLKFLKIGAIGFGGGSALIPVIECETKDLKDGLDNNEFDKDVVAASITPGALPVEIASGVGEAVGGIRGMWLAACSMAFPGAAMTILFLMVFSASSEMVIHQIGYAAAGINIFILVIITDYVIESVKRFEKNRRLRAGMMIFAVFILTTFMGVSTISILMAAFFVILYTEGNIHNLKMPIAVVISGFYFLGNEGAYPFFINAVVKIAMVILAIWGVFDTFRKSKDLEILDWKRLKLLGKEVGVWILTVVVLGIPAVLSGKELLLYIMKGIWSSLISFGGGDAYLSIADGIFVAGGMIGGQIFYRQIVPVANALPGSILCKILSGIGFSIGYGLHGSYAEGIMVAAAGFGVSVSMSCMVFMIVRYIYECFENWHIFQMLKRWIGTIIAGLLLTVGTTMIQDNVEFMNESGMAGVQIFVLCTGIYLLNLVLQKKMRVQSLVCIILSGVLSFIYCSYLG